MTVAEPTLLRRGPLLITALLAAVGGGAIYVFALPALWRMSWPYGLLFTALGVAQFGTVGAVLSRPVRWRVLLAAATALAVVVLWALVRFAGVLPALDPWVPANSVIGFADYICAGLQTIAALGLAGVAALGPRPRRSLPRRVLAALALAPLVALVLLGVVVGVLGSSDGFAGAGFPAGTVAPQNLPAGRMSTVEYCRPDGVPLAMDLYIPPAAALAGRPAAVAMYLHGGGALGDRKMHGAGASLANHQGALFTPLQQQLNAQGFVVAAIDHRLPPGTPWPAQIEDAKCAVRFLRAHAADLGIDPGRIGVWGSSGGGHLALLLGLTGPGDGFDQGQYLDQSSAVQAVVDMFGPADLTNFSDSAPFGRFMVQVIFGGSTAVRRSASPITYVAPGAPPFLILQGTEDTMVRPRQSAELAQRLSTAGVPVTLIEVQGTEHSLDTPGERPSPDELTATVIDFFVAMLK
ncbi:MAG: alpha/beta hydrolase [Anaerolineae bacterium]|jgi:acetyl esterase/lipase